MSINRSKNQAKRSEQYIQNASYDEDYDVLAFEALSFDGVNLQRSTAGGAMAIKVTEATGITYIAFAAPGTSQATAKWKALKVDESVAGTTTITWAASGAFNQVASDLTALTYA